MHFSEEMVLLAFIRIYGNISLGFSAPIQNKLKEPQTTFFSDLEGIKLTTVPIVKLKTLMRIWMFPYVPMGLFVTVILRLLCAEEMFIQGQAECLLHSKFLNMVVIVVSVKRFACYS